MTAKAPFAESKSESKPDHVGPILLSFSFACFLFFCLLYAFREGGIVEKEEFRVFALAWLTVPICTIAVTALVRRLAPRVLGQRSLGMLVLLLAHTAYWWSVVSTLHTLFPSGTIPHDRDALGPPLARLLEVYVVGNLVLWPLVSLSRRITGWPRLVARLRTVVDLALPFAFCAAALPFFPRPVPPWMPWLVSLALGIAAPLFTVGESSARAERLRRWSFHALVLLMIALFVYDPLPDVEIQSHNFYLGPVASILTGRTPLVDVNCQYGVGPLYLIAAVMKLHLIPRSFVGFGRLLSALLVLNYWLYYGLLLVLTKNRRVAAAITALAVIVCYFGQEGFQIFYPSTGPLRFGWGYVFLGSLALRARFPRSKRLATGVECLAVGASSIWSLESCVYLAAAFVAAHVFLAVHEPSLRASIRATSKRLLPPIVAVVVAHLALALFTRARSGEWPHWSRYVDYVLVYSTQEFGTLLITTFTPWVFLIAAYLFSVLAFGYRRIALGRRTFEPADTLLFAATGLGIAQFTYFLGRSHPNNLFHVSGPVFLVAAGWLTILRRDVAGSSRTFRATASYFVTAAAAFLALTCVPDFLHKYDHSLVSLASSSRDIPAVVHDARTLDAVHLIHKYARHPRIALLTTPDLAVDTFLSSHTGSVWPSSYPAQDELVPAAMTRANAADTGLTDGDIVFLDTNGVSAEQGVPVGDIIDVPTLARDVYPVDRRFFEALAKQFSFRVVEHTSSGLMAARLVRRAPG